MPLKRNIAPMALTLADGESQSPQQQHLPPDHHAQPTAQGEQRGQGPALSLPPSANAPSSLPVHSSSSMQQPIRVGDSTSSSILMTATNAGTGGRRAPQPLSSSGQSATLNPQTSFMVSESGNNLTLGERYKVSPSGLTTKTQPPQPPARASRQQTLNRLEASRQRTTRRASLSHPSNLSTATSSVFSSVVGGEASEYTVGVPGVATGGLVQSHTVPAGSGTSILCQHVDELDFDNGVQIGRGSSGKVFNVLHVPSGVRVCVKQMMIDEARNRDEVKKELDALSSMASSRFVVDFYGVFFHNELGVILLVLELMEGSLLEVLRLKKRLTEQQAKAFALQVMHGLKFLHTERRLIHRDIKPANLLFHRSGQVKITDFGVSTGQRSQDPQSVLTFVGSILYMSPERLEAKSYGYDCDIWSLGIMLCEAVTGYHPYQEEFGEQAEQLTFWGLLQKVMKADPERHRSPIGNLLGKMPPEMRAQLNVSPELENFVARCLAFDKTDRATSEELLNHPWITSMSLEEAESIVKGITVEVAASRDTPAATPSSLRGGSRSPTPPTLTPDSKGPESPKEETRAKGNSLLEGLLLGK